MILMKCIFDKALLNNLKITHIVMNQAQNSKIAFLSERKFAILILLFQIGMILAHGFGAYYPSDAQTTPQTDYSDQMILYTLTGFLALLGYGLVIAYSDNSSITGLVTTLIVVTISVQLTPLLLQFWYDVFNGFPQRAEISLKTERVTMALCTSLLASLTSLVGRLGKIQTFIIIIMYNIGWTLSFEATQYLQAQKSPSAPPLYDDFGTNYVYVFAGLFAFFASIIINLKKGKVHPIVSHHTAFVSLIGTGFIFACFPFTGILFPTAAASNVYRRAVGPLNIYFALSASVIWTYISSAIFGRLKIDVKSSLVGVLSGGVMIGTVAGTINNIGGCLLIGAIAGFISGFYLQVLDPKLNGSKAIDHLGIFGPILICSVFGGLVLSPAMYRAYMDQNISPSSFGTQITDSSIILYQLVYIGVTALISSGFGLLSGLLCYKFRDSQNDFELSKLISQDFRMFRAEDGARPQEAEAKPEVAPEAEAKIKAQSQNDVEKQSQIQKPAPEVLQGNMTDNPLRNDASL